MGDSCDERLPLPEGPFGLPGFSGYTGSKGTHTPAGKKKEQSRRREEQVRKSRKINRRKQDTSWPQPGSLLRGENPAHEA
jgi:hypothetical protein